MNKPRGQNLFFVFAVLVFSFLLLSGGSRLIAAPDEKPLPLLPAQSWLEASLSCPPAPGVHDAHDASVLEGGANKITVVCANVDAEGFNLPQTDANGNVISHVSYMHAVYQVFALGDGFA